VGGKLAPEGGFDGAGPGLQVFPRPGGGFFGVKTAERKSATEGGPDPGCRFSEVMGRWGTLFVGAKKPGGHFHPRAGKRGLFFAPQEF